VRRFYQIVLAVVVGAAIGAGVFFPEEISTLELVLLGITILLAWVNIRLTS
jgi:superfamily II helicase